MLEFKGINISFGEEIKGREFEQIDNGDIYINKEAIKPESLEVSFDGKNFLKVDSKYEVCNFEEFTIKGFKSNPDRDTSIRQPNYKNKVYTILIEK